VPVTIDRYARQQLIPGWDQARVAGATAVIIGVGAVGNEAAKNLALAGVGRLILCDPDTVAVSNLSRTVLLGSHDIGTPKVEAAARALRDLVPGITAEPRVADLGSGVGLGELADAAVVLSCVDTIRGRMRLLGRAALVGAALVDGGTHHYGGEVRVRLSPEEACYGCSLSPHERGMSDLPWSCFGTPPDGPQPASIATTALVAAWMTLAALGIILGTPPGYQILSIDASTGRTAPVIVDRDMQCPHHRPFDGAPDLNPATNRSTLRELLATLNPDDEPFTWEQFTVGMRCGNCRREVGAQQSWEQGSGRAADAVRMVSVCDNCGGFMRARFSQRLRDADPNARLSGLGVAPEDILSVRASGGDYRCLRLS
jgi:hypothetical protein